MKKRFIWVLLILSGFLLLHQRLVYQPFLASGDHGRDLYAFEATMRGQLPYKDYWWVYGPLTPYYYSIFFKLFGVAISSVLLGKFLLNLAAGIFFFATLSFFIPSMFAYVATLWFWIFKPEFFFTYNHIAGITCLMAIVYYMLDHFRNKNLISLYAALLATFALSLIKINFGIIALILLILFTYLPNRFNKKPISKGEKRFYWIALAGMPLAVFLVYWSLLNTLPIYAIRQCLPYLASDHPNNAPFLLTAKAWWNTIAVNINISWQNRIFAALLLCSILQTLRNLHRNTFNPVIKKEVQYAILLFMFFYCLNMHEYFASAVIYRAYWAKPFSMLLVFLFLGLAVKNFPKKIQVLLILTLFAIVFTRFNSEVKHVETLRDLNKNLGMDRASILTTNSNSWQAAVKQTTSFLKKNLAPEESFFALPYDPLYYYLTGKKSPTRQLIFFDHIKIPEEQERKIILELESNNTNWAVISNRSASPERGMGIFGQTYCPLLARYLRDHFEPVAAFGDGMGPPGWVRNHSVQILKRKIPIAPAGSIR
ncbi:MAG: hypothetical protein KAR32_01655 [Candidatus Omnitrophica bacterium]|nr:hypothetical protein [Candidatus Omnitrophota bacterium]